MSEDTEGQKSSVNWGELGKNILAGAAILAGAILVFPSLVPALGGALASMGAAFTGSAALGTILKVGAGIGLAIAGATHLMADKAGSADEVLDKQAAQYDQRSFAAEHDIRKMQALMIARMQAQGHEPAMAMAQSQMGR